MVYKLDNGGVDCHIISNWVITKREEIFKTPGVAEYFADDFNDDEKDKIGITPLKEDKELKINFDGILITHTAAEWQAIYGHKTGIICQSEY